MRYGAHPRRKPVRCDIPDANLRRAFERHLAGNPDSLPMIGGAQVPADPRGHLDVLITILARIFDLGIEGFDYVPPHIETGVPGGDYDQLVASIERLADLDADIMYPGHGPAVEGGAVDHIRMGLRMVRNYAGG